MRSGWASPTMVAAVLAALFGMGSRADADSIFDLLTTTNPTARWTQTEDFRFFPESITSSYDVTTGAFAFTSDHVARQAELPDGTRVGIQSDLLSVAAVVMTDGTLVGGSVLWTGAIADLGVPAGTVLMAGDVVDINYGAGDSPGAPVLFEFVFDVSSSLPALGMGPYMGYQAFHTPRSPLFRANPWSVSYNGGSAFSHDQMFRVAPVPEPSTWGLLTIGAFGLAICRRRRRATIERT